MIDKGYAKESYTFGENDKLIENIMDKVIKTGTTIVGLKYATGIVLCADTRSTSGPIVKNKNTEKIHYIAPKIYCCGAGVAADTRRVTRMASKELELFKFKYLKDPLVSHAHRTIVDYLFKYNGGIQSALILGGIDSINGVSLIKISPDSHSKNISYGTLGSGSYAALGILESRYRDDMSIEDAMELGSDAIKAGVLNDLYSGSNVDLIVIDEKFVDYHRNYLVVEKKRSQEVISYPKGSIQISKEEIFNLIEEI